MPRLPITPRSYSPAKSKKSLSSRQLAAQSTTGDGLGHYDNLYVEADATEIIDATGK